MRLTGDQKFFSKNFEKNFLNFLIFEKYSVENDGFFAVSSWGGMVFEIYAYPRGFFLAL